jgi:hypothetical protein
VTGDDDENVLDVFETSAQVQFGMKVVRKSNARQVTLVGPIADKLAHVVGVNVPQPYRSATASKL